MANIFSPMDKRSFSAFFVARFPVARFPMAVILLMLASAAYAQTGNRQKTIDSLKEVIGARKDSLPALRQYIAILGLKNDTVKTQFDAWMKQYPKSYSIPYALGEAYYKAKDREGAVNYFMKAYRAGDTAQRMFKMMSVAQEEKWAIDVPITVNTIDSLKRVIEGHPDSTMPLQQYIFVMGNTNETLPAQFDAWMKQFPNSAAIPFVIGETYCNMESPKATPFLLKAVELKPGNAPAWEMLSIDAERWGNEDLAREYMGKASAAAPEDAGYAFYYAMDFERTDPALWRKKLWELTKKFPDNERGAQGLYWLAFRSQDSKEKLDVYEQLRKLYPPAKFSWSEGGMDGLYGLYLQQGFTDKAIELATSMGDKEGFPEKAESAKRIRVVRGLIKDKKYTEAKQEIGHLKLPRYSEATNMLALLKAEVSDAAGSPQSAYDSLLLVQAKEPDDGIADAIAKYGTKLGKSKQQTEKDLWSIRDKKIKPAPPFELGLYTSDAKAKLEDFKGKVVLMTFWFPGCGPCRGEMPHFQHVVDKFSKNDLAYIGINVTPEQDEYVLPFMKGTKFSFIPLRGNEKWAEQVYHVRGEPTNFLIDKDGKIVYSDFMITGNNERMLELMIKSMLERI
jgi:thiol-disulfide isomerase/thioredoxin